MSLKQHRKYRLWFLRVAAKEVKRRDYLAAADAYRAAAYHEAVISAAGNLEK